MKLRLLLSISFIIISLAVLGQADYPIPPETNKMLFYLQRSHNRNTVIYNINTLPDGTINEEKPVDIYWIRYEEDERKAELSYIQKKAFGVQHKLVDKAKENFILHFNRFGQREVFLFKSSAGKYKAFMKINNELAEFKSAFIKSENNSLGMPIVVKFIEFHGISIKSRKIISETYIP
jgi:hypothetical protein